MNTIMLSKINSLKVRDDLQQQALEAILNSPKCMEYLIDAEMSFHTSTRQMLYILKVVSALVALKQEWEDDEVLKNASDVEIRRISFNALMMAEILEKECNYLTKSEEYKDQLIENDEYYYLIKP